MYAGYLCEGGCQCVHGSDSTHWVDAAVPVGYIELPPTLLFREGTSCPRCGNPVPFCDACGEIGR
jgi:hypothetical protein